MTEEEVEALPPFLTDSTGSDVTDSCLVLEAGVVRDYKYPFAAHIVPVGWWVKALSMPVGLGTYTVEDLQVLSNGRITPVLCGTLVAILPPDYRETVDGPR